jgi:hypothetical protein
MHANSSIGMGNGVGMGASAKPIQRHGPPMQLLPHMRGRGFPGKPNPTGPGLHPPTQVSARACV